MKAQRILTMNSSHVIFIAEFAKPLVAGHAESPGEFFIREPTTATNANCHSALISGGQRKGSGF